MSTTVEPAISLSAAVDQLQEIGQIFWQRGWSVGTSSNYSVLLNRNPKELLITASGHDKRKLGRDEFVVVNETGRPIDDSQPRPSAETLLHVVATDQPEVGAVLHTHSIWGTLLSDYYFAQGAVPLEGYEMLKGLEGIRTHETKVSIEIFDNTQDIAALSEVIRGRFADQQNPLQYGFLMRNHGLYTWGRTLADAFRHIEVLEFLFEVAGRKLSLPRPS